MPVTTPSPKEQFLEAYDREFATTMRVVRAYPDDKWDLRPHKMCKSARELAWMFTLEQGLCERALTTGFDWSVPPSMPAAPDSTEALLAAFDQAHGRVAAIVRGLPDDQMARTAKFFTELRRPT